MRLGGFVCKGRENRSQFRRHSQNLRDFVLAGTVDSLAVLGGLRMQAL